MAHSHGDGTYRFCPKCSAPLEERQLMEIHPPRLVCTRCGFVFYMDPKLAAGTISMLGGGIVLLRRAIEPQKGRWVFPGGFVDRGETVHGAAIRETWEEVGLRVTLTGILDVYSFPGEAVAVVVYAAEVAGGELTVGDEAEDVRAFPPETIPWDELAFASTQEALRDYVHRFFPRVRIPRQ
ncbi:MAG TPA: NUDIX hydrolase [Vicinamibacteria bacterium]|nr:NUDIX hydrolase [Vicinamibacteria bacterium]